MSGQAIAQMHLVVPLAFGPPDPKQQITIYFLQIACPCQGYFTGPEPGPTGQMHQKVSFNPGFAAIDQVRGRLFTTKTQQRKYFFRLREFIPGDPINPIRQTLLHFDGRLKQLCNLNRSNYTQSKFKRFLAMVNKM
jgi:hypothetical protein